MVVLGDTLASSARLYRGHGQNVSCTRHVSVEVGGETVGLLRHHGRYSETGLNWGYLGLGPKDLAMSILVDALGDHALCGGCAGAGCDHCWRGYSTNLPIDPFTTDVVAKLPASGWIMTIESVWDWSIDHGFFAASDRNEQR